MADRRRSAGDLQEIRNLVASLAAVAAGGAAFVALLDAPLAVKLALGGVGWLGLTATAVLSVLEFQARRGSQVRPFRALAAVATGAAIAGAALLALLMTRDRGYAFQTFAGGTLELNGGVRMAGMRGPFRNELSAAPGDVVQWLLDTRNTNSQTRS